MSISLRIPPAVKRRVAKLAAAQATTPHAFMVEAIQEKIEAEEAQATFMREAEARLVRMKSTGLGVPAEEVFEYFRRRAGGKQARRPKARVVR